MKKVIISALITLFMCSTNAMAHSGGTNSSGCHSGSKPYHCHNKKTQKNTHSYNDYSGAWKRTKKREEEWKKKHQRDEQAAKERESQQVSTKVPTSTTNGYDGSLYNIFCDITVNKKTKKNYIRLQIDMSGVTLFEQGRWTAHTPWTSTNENESYAEWNKVNFVMYNPHKGSRMIVNKESGKLFAEGKNGLGVKIVATGQCRQEQ